MGKKNKRLLLNSNKTKEDDELDDIIQELIREENQKKSSNKIKKEKKMAEPKIISFVNRYFSIDNINEGIQYNVFKMKGIPVSIEIEMDTAYLVKKPKIFYPNSQKDAIKGIFENVELKKLIGTFKESFTSTETNIYGFYFEDKLYIYDIVSNSNHYAFNDLIVIRDNYKYGDRGFNVLEPIASIKGNKEVFLKFYFDNKDKEEMDKLFILPAYTIVSSPTYLPYSENSYNGIDTTPAYTYGEDFCFKEETEETVVKENKTTVKVEEKNSYSLFNPKECKIKLDMKQVNEIKSSIENNMIASKSVFIDSEKKSVGKISLLWYKWSNVEFMGTFHDTLTTMFKKDIVLAGIMKKETKYKIIADVFRKLWNEHESMFVSKIVSNKDLETTIRGTYFEKMMSKEFDLYVEAYLARYGSMLADESKLKKVN